MTTTTEPTTTVSRYVIAVDVDTDSGVHRVAVDHRDAAWRCVTCRAGARCKYISTARAAAADAGLDPTEAIS